MENGKTLLFSHENVQNVERNFMNSNMIISVRIVELRWSGMSDFIKREGAMDILDKLSSLDKSGILEVVRCGIETLPYVQPEIIYCKDCKYSHMTIDGLCKYCDIWFPNEEMYEDGKHFCASAKKKML